MLDFEVLAREIMENGGASVSLEGKKPKRGYMVSNSGCEVVLDHLPSARDLKQYRQRYARELLKSGAYLGAWVDSGKCCLDVSRRVSRKSKALATARKNKQLAFFDLSSFESIPTA
jgi:hypothetical protein